MDVGLLLYFPQLLLALVLAFYLPGNLFVARIPLTKFQQLILSLNLGIVLWGLQGFLFGYLHARWLTYLYLLLALIIWISTNRQRFKKFKLSFSVPDKHTLLLSIFIAVAVFIPTQSAFANGITIPKGILFCCQLPDSLFHIALTNELITTFPPYEPGVSGILLKNYHFLSNLINADLIRIFHIPVLYMQYPYSTLLINLLFALTLVIFSQLIIKKKAYTYWLLFFVFLSGDMLYLLTFIKFKTFNFDTSVLGDPTTMWYSPPRVYGAYLLFSGLTFLTLWLREKKNIFLDVAVACTFGCLISIKVYFSIFALAGLGMLFLLYAKEKNYRKLLVIITVFLISLGLYLPINSGAGGFIFTGFWRFEDFASNQFFGLRQMELARAIYVAHGNWLRNLQYHLTYVLYYFVFVFGTLMFAVFQTKKSLTLLPAKLNYFLLTGFIVCFVLGSFFIQQTGGSNSSQFLITDMMMVPLYAALAVSYWLGKIKRKVIVIPLIALIVLFTIPRVIYVTVHQILVPRNLVVDTTELQAMAYITNNIPKNAVILQDYLHYCLQFSIITKRQTYMCDDASPEDHGENLKKRKKLQSDIMQYDNALAIKDLPLNHGIQYLYMKTSVYNVEKYYFQKNLYPLVFHNKEITILKNP